MKNKKWEELPQKMLSKEICQKKKKKRDVVPGE